MNSTQMQKIDEIFGLWQGENTPGGQVLVRKGGEIIYDKCFGNAILEHKLPITNDTVFHVASVSKQVTIMAMLILWNEGKIDLDADIRTYLPEYIAFEEAVTVRQCMNNVSGIRDQWELLMLWGTRIDDVILQSDLLKVISTQKELNFEPQSQYLYSNSNFTLCAELVHKISGKNLAEFAKERIFDVLGMNITCVKLGYTDIVDNRANSYLDNGSQKFVNKPLNFGVAGATSLNTNAHDFVKLVDEYKNPKHFDKAIFDMMFTPAVLSDGTTAIYGGGMMIQDYKGITVRSHSGVDAGYRADIAMYTDADIDIIIFSNTMNLIPSVASKKIVDVLLELPEDTAFAVSEKADECVCGTYLSCNEPYLMLTVAEKNGVLCSNNNPLVLVENSTYAIGNTTDRIDLGKAPHFKIGAAADTLRKIEVAAVNPAHLGKFYCEELETVYSIKEKDGKMLLCHYKNGEQVLFGFAENAYTTALCRVEMTEEGFRMSGNRAKHLRFVRV